MREVKRAICAFQNPFDVPDKERIYIIFSGNPVPVDAETDILSAEIMGRKQREEFTAKLCANSQVNFFEPIKQLKLKTMAVAEKASKLTNSQGKVVQYKEQADLAVTLLVRSQVQNAQLDLLELLSLSYSLFTVPPSLGTADGWLNKTAKAAILEPLLKGQNTKEHLPKEAVHELTVTHQCMP